MRVAVLTDAHANLPALEAALAAIQCEGCDAIYHTGDAIAIGPYPAECVDLLLSTPKMHPIMGNHEVWFVHGLPQPQPAWLNDGEVVHQHWVHAQLRPSLRPVIGRWPYVIEEQFEGVRMTLLHYGLDDSGSGFAPAHRDASPNDLDRLFGHYDADLVFYGHVHAASDHSVRSRYVNPGSLGCTREAVARFAVLECTNSRYTLTQRAVPYDDTALFEAFERRQVPERMFLYQAFFGGRYTGT